MSSGIQPAPQTAAPAQQTQSGQATASITPKLTGSMPEAIPKLENIEVSSEGMKAVSEQAIQKSIQNLNELLKAKQTNVTLEYDSLSSPKMINIVDSESGKVIRNMPPQVVVDIAEKAKNYILGLMIDKAI